jgi:hypothetical protein
LLLHVVASFDSHELYLQCMRNVEVWKARWTEQILVCSSP